MSHPKVVIWVSWRRWYESAEGSDMSQLKAVIWVSWRRWYESSEGGDLSCLKVRIWVGWRWWYESSQGGDMSHLRVVIWVCWRCWSEQQLALRLCWRWWSECTEGGLKSEQKVVIWVYLIDEFSSYAVLSFELSTELSFSKFKLGQLVIKDNQDFKNQSFFQIQFKILKWKYASHKN